MSLKKIFLPMMAIGMSDIESALDQLESVESMEWYESLKPEQQEEIKGESFELLTGQTYESMSKIFSHEQLVKIAYDKLKIEGFDV
jgi:hypothetical protein